MLKGKLSRDDGFGCNTSPEVVNGERIDIRPPPQEPMNLHAITNIAIDASI